MARRITVDMLREAGACESAVETFEREWPHGGTITLRNCRRAVVLGLDLDWAAKQLLSANQWATFEAAIAPAWVAYEAAIARAEAAYEAAKARAEAACEAAKARAEAAYEAAKARAFWEVAKIDG